MLETYDDDLAKHIPYSPVRKEDVVIKPVANWADWDRRIIEAMEDGYLPIGKCEQGVFAYRRPLNFYTPWSLAADQAVNVGADLVLIGRNETMTPETRVVSDTFGIATGNTFGVATGNAFGDAIGNSYSQGFYSGNTTSYQQNLWALEKRAYFFRKGNFDSFYGAIITARPPLPDETENSPVDSRVLVVIKGSLAEKDGIKKGQKVTKINGRPIKTYKDLYEVGSISSMEVER